MTHRLRNLTKLCHGNQKDCQYLDYEAVKLNKSDWDSPTRYKFRWMKQKQELPPKDQEDDLE